MQNPDVETTEINCPNCGDSRAIECDDCDGSGLLSEDGIDYHIELGEAEICDQCGGSGELECPECS